MKTLKCGPRKKANGAQEQRQAGHALLLSAIIGTLAFGLWLVAFRSTNDAQGFHLGAENRQTTMEALPSAMAKAGRLLQSGEPPKVPFHCVFKHYVAPGEWTNIHLKFDRGGGSRKWSVEATLATTQDIRRYPGAPESFDD
jgi:hypothetical protein